MTNAAPPAFLVFDCESIPDGVLLAKTKYAGEKLTPDEAIQKAQEEAREKSASGSDFLPVSYQIPVAVCIGRVGPDYRLQSLVCLDDPQFRPAEITRGFWKGVEHYKAKLVTFNGRSFDLPLLELAAFRYGVSAPQYFGARGARYRYGDGHRDLHDLLGNYGAVRLAGGLNLFSKLLGKPGKMDTWGHQVLDLHRQGKLREINHYCTHDVLDTYFVFLRHCVLTGELTLEQEQQIVRDAKDWLAEQAASAPHFGKYLENWGDWEPWP